MLIARALAGEPDLFFLDEPTAGVDLPNQHALADTLRRAQGARRHDRAGRPRARPARAADRPRRGDARRPGGVRRRRRSPSTTCTRPRSPSRTPPSPPRDRPAPRPRARTSPSPLEAVAADGPPRLRLHAAGAARRGRHRARRAGGRHLPGAAPARPDGRRHRPRRRHRRRPRPAHRHLPDLDRGRGGRRSARS